MSTIARLDSVMSPAGDDQGIERRGTSGDYCLHYHMGSGYYVSFYLRSTSNPGSATCHKLYDVEIGQLAIRTDQEDASIVRNGSGWSAKLSQVLAFGGSYRRTSTAGDSATFTTRDNTTVVGFMGYAGNAGLTKVLIDGNPTLATSIPTAQDYVDAGTFPNTILVANGGTLNPTDRCIDQYSYASYIDGLITLADDLTAGVHTVQIVCTGYKRAASTDVRMYMQGFFTNAIAGENLGTTGAGIRFVQYLLTTTSTWEYAITYLPDGASDDETFHGNGHGYDYQDSLTIEADDVTVMPAYWDAVRGASKMEVVRVSRLRHIDLPSTDCADIVTTYTVDGNGLTISYAIDWLVDGNAVRYYAAMMSCDEYLDTGELVGGSTYDLTPNDGSYHGQIDTNAGILYDPDGHYASYVKIPDPATSLANYAYNGTIATAIQDRDMGGLNKIYFTRSDNNEPFEAGDVWTCETIYKVKYFDDILYSLFSEGVKVDTIRQPKIVPGYDEYATYGLGGIYSSRRG